MWTLHPRALRRLSSSPTFLNRGPRVSTVFAALSLLGIGTVAYGVYEFYTSLMMWPPEVRDDLRAGVKSKHRGDLALSERYLRRAWETAQTLPPEKLAPEPYLKLSGIGIALAGVLEDHAAPEQAYEVYVDVLQILQRQSHQLGNAERMRAVAVACKLGEMAEMYQQPPEEEERWLTWAVGELIRIMKDPQDGSQDRGEVEELRVVLSELDLPSWVSKTDLGAPFEVLGAFYARAGNIEYAMPLYLQAISILIPSPPPKASSPEDRCRGAQLMSNLSELIIRSSPMPDKLPQAEAWAKQALNVIHKTKETARGDTKQLSTCEHALAAVLFNLGSMREMANDLSSARDLFSAGLEQSETIGMKQGITEARAALRRLDRLERKKES